MSTEPKPNTLRAWINMQRPKPNSGGRIHVAGAIYVGDEKVKYDLSKALSQPISGTELLLEVYSSPSKGEYEAMLNYHEDLPQEVSLFRYAY